MLTITALTLLAQIQVSSSSLAAGCKLKGGTFRAETAAQQTAISPAQWESHKHVRYLGQVDYALRAATAEPAPKAVKPEKVPPAAKARRR